MTRLAGRSELPLSLFSSLFCLQAFCHGGPEQDGLSCFLGVTVGLEMVEEPELNGREEGKLGLRTWL